MSGMKGEEWMEGYEEVGIERGDFEGKNVLIVGAGNSGLEMAQHIYPYANLVHLMTRRRVRFSWDTHYVGDIRGINNEIFDSYMLKSLDGVLQGGGEGTYIRKLPDGRLQLRSADFAGINYLDQNPVRQDYDKIIRCIGFTRDNTLFHNSTIPNNSKLIADGSKYPDIDYDFQSTQFPNLYFAGTLTHSLDFRKSAGGFIHGFRYNARALHHFLNWKNHAVVWPYEEKALIHLLPLILKRVNEGSGIYQMFQFLADIVIVNREEETFKYLKEYPIKLIPRLEEKSGHKVGNSSLIVIAMEYGANFSQAGDDHFAHKAVSKLQVLFTLKYAHKSNFLHPVLYFHHRNTEKADGVHHIIEDFLTTFDGPSTHILPTRRFLEFFLETDLRLFKPASCTRFMLAFHAIRQPPSNCIPFLSVRTSIFASARRNMSMLE